MSRRAAVLAAGAVALLAILALVWWRVAGRPAQPGTAGEAPAGEDEPGTVAVELYYPSTAGWLGRESREIAGGGTAIERAGRIAQALLEGPVDSGLRAPIAGATLAGIHLAGGALYVDLTAADQPTPPVAGSRNELLAVYSFVNSILTNVPEARAVALLWNGEQRPTFAGHVDTTYPLPADPEWQAR